MGGELDSCDWSCSGGGSTCGALAPEEADDPDIASAASSKFTRDEPLAAESSFGRLWLLRREW